MKYPFTTKKVRHSRHASLTSVLTAGASSLVLIAGLALASTGTASATTVAHAASTAPCTITVAGGGTAVPGQQLIVGVVAGATKVTFDCNTSAGGAVVAEASVLAAISSSGVLPTAEADTTALATFTPNATDTGCPAATAGSCELATFAVPATFATSDPNAVCPPSAAQINAGIFGCALAVATSANAEVLGGEYLIQYASQTVAPNPPTIKALQTSGAPGSLINVSDAASNTGYWWGDAIQANQAALSGTAAQTAPSACGTGAGYGNVPSSNIFDVWYITGTSTKVGGGPATGVTISNDCYNGKTLSPPVLSGTLTVPSTVTTGAAYTVYLCEANATPYPSNDTAAATNCGSAQTIDASFSFSATAKTITQNLPQTNTVAAASSAGFTDQLTASGNNGAVTYTQTAGTPSLVVSATGAVSTSGALKAGSYTASGTTADASGDAGTFTYTLTVTGATTTPPPVTKPAPVATRVDGYAIPGRTVTVSILGRNFVKHGKIIGHAGTIATNLSTTATKMTVRVREVAGARAGAYRFTIQFPNGKKTSVVYRVR
jgi:hypothetical protein